MAITEKVAQSNLPEDSFMHRDPSPKDGYLKTVWFSDANSDAIGEINQWGVKRETIVSIVAKIVRRNQTRLKEEEENQN